MDIKTLASYEGRVRVFKAMAHPTRLFIIEELSRAGERCVCELTKMIGDDISTVSKHLSVLKNARIVADHRRGSQVFYRLRTPCILDFLRCVQSVTEESAEAEEDVESNGNCVCA